jgi:glycosyltransferase involved in cell wall biosynthesis
MGRSGSDEPLQKRTAAVTVAADGGASAFQFGSADEWRVLVTLGGAPLARLRIPDPGSGGGRALFDATVLAACDDERRRALVTESLRRRIGGGTEHPRRTVSVVVCTRDRLETLAPLLDALGRLEPTADEVIVVDNAPPPGRDCRALVDRAGARYVREDAPGLNNARRAGVAASTGELVAFTDDDCLPPPTWLAALDELFDDENAAAVTGPAFPLRLDTPSRVRFEEAASFDRGLLRQELDWTVMSPADATRAGAGANMILRRSFLDEAGEVFPPELDVGTPTCSGGDLYALFKVLAAGRRITYDPRVFTYHLHRSDPAALERAIHGYGVGLSAVATKLLVEERELGGLRVWSWLVRQYLRAVRLGLMGRTSPSDVRMAWTYLRGGLEGPRALRRAQRGRQGPRQASPFLEAPAKAPAPVAGGEHPLVGAPVVSVVLITHRADNVVGPLAGLAAQQPGTPPFEVVLVDDSKTGVTEGLESPSGLPLRRVATGGRGAAAARNAGALAARAGLLLFLDDDLVPADDLVRAHLDRHEREPRDAIVIGYSPPRPVRSTLAAQAAALWWEDHFRAKREMAAPTFVDMLSGNMSVKREVFERLGGFEAAFGAFRREDWEFGIRALRADVRLVYEHGAVARHEFDLATRSRIAAAVAEGRGDAMLVERYPFCWTSLALAWNPAPRGARGRLAFALLRNEQVREAAVRGLDLLERARMRIHWARWFNLVQRAAYESGLREGGGRDAVSGLPPVIQELDLDSSERLPAPDVVAPVLRPMVAGRRVAPDVPPGEGQWVPALASRAVSYVRAPALAELVDLERPLVSANASLDEVVVLFGPAALAADARHAVRLADAGVEVRILQGERHWEEIDKGIRASGRRMVAIPMPGVAPEPAWLREALVAFEGDRVAAVTGAGVGPPARGRPLLLFEGPSAEGPYPILGLPSQYLIVRRDVYLQLGGFDLAAARLGMQAPVLDLLERARAARWLVGHRNTPGLSPPLGPGSARRWAEWRRWTARGALIGRDRRSRGTVWVMSQAVLPASTRLLRTLRPGAPGRRHALGTAAALTRGLVRGTWRA